MRWFFMCKIVCSKRVDLPIPGSPPMSVIEPGTIPPPNTRSSSKSVVLMRGSSSAVTSDSLTGSGACCPMPVRAWRLRRSLLTLLLSGRMVISFIVFHAPHEGHRPTHLGESIPHSEHTYTVFCFIPITLPPKHASCPLVLRAPCASVE